MLAGPGGPASVVQVQPDPATLGLTLGARRIQRGRPLDAVVVDRDDVVEVVAGALRPVRGRGECRRVRVRQLGAGVRGDTARVGLREDAHGAALVTLRGGRWSSRGARCGPPNAPSDPIPWPPFRRGRGSRRRSPPPCRTPRRPAGRRPGRAPGRRRPGWESSSVRGRRSAGGHLAP